MSKLRSAWGDSSEVFQDEVGPRGKTLRPEPETDLNIRIARRVDVKPRRQRHGGSIPALDAKSG